MNHLKAFLKAASQVDEVDLYTATLRKLRMFPSSRVYVIHQTMSGLGYGVESFFGYSSKELGHYPRQDE